MKRNKKKKNKVDNWKVPKNAIDYFDPHYDDDFKASHPILFWLTVLAIVVLVCVGPFIFIPIASQIQPDFNSPYLLINAIETVILLVGLVGSLGISIGLCNVFMILHKQYLGHWVTLITLGIGVVSSALSLLLLWLI